jgi:hypothetical protein
MAGTTGAAGATAGAGGTTGAAGATAGTTGAAGATAGTTGAAGATGTAGATAGTSGAAGATAGAGGATAGAGGATAGAGGATGGASGGRTGGAGSSGTAGSSAGAGGRSQGGGGGRGGAAGGGAAGAGAGGAGGGGYLCNEVLGFTITSEWYDAGFENGVVDARWQIKFREHGYITEWANPASAFWGNDAANGAPISSPCAQNSTSPDHVVLNVLSWTITAQQEWTTDITAAVNTIVAKYPNVRRIDLMTIIRGPGDMLCPTPPAAGETIVIAPELDAAMQAVAAQFPGFVYVAPKFEVTSCTQFSGGGPHLTTAGNMAMAPTLATYFATTQ